MNLYEIKKGTSKTFGIGHIVVFNCNHERLDLSADIEQITHKYKVGEDTFYAIIVKSESPALRIKCTKGDLCCGFIAKEESK